MIKKCFCNKKILIILCITFLVMLVFNIMTPMVADDYTYSFSWSSNMRTDSVGEVYRSMVVHWIYWHCRVIANGLATLFLMLPAIVFDIFNAAVFTLIVAIIIFISYIFSDEEKNIVPVALFAVTSLWSFTPSFGQVFLWLDGSCNYSWAVVFELAYLIPFLYWLSGHKFNPSVIQRIAIVLVSFIAGAYYESGAISAIFIAGCIFCFMLIKYRKTDVFLLISWIISIIGFIIIMNAPSMKLGHRGSLSFDAVLNFISSLYSSIGYILKNTSLTYIIAAVLAALCLIVIIILTRKNKKIVQTTVNVLIIFLSAAITFIVLKDKFSELSSADEIICLLVSSPVISLCFISVIYLLLLIDGLFNKANITIIYISLVLFAAGIGSVAAFIFAGYFPARATVFYVAYLICACGILLASNDCPKHSHARFIYYICTAVFALCFIFGAKDIIHIHLQNAERISIINSALEHGEKEIYLEAFSPKTKYSAPYGLDDLVDDSDTGWINTQICRYYGLDTVYLKK